MIFFLRFLSDLSKVEKLLILYFKLNINSKLIFYIMIPVMIVSALKFKMFLKVLWERSYKGYLKLKCFKTQMHLSTVLRHSQRCSSLYKSWGSRLRSSGGKINNNIRICNN